MRFIFTLFLSFWILIPSLYAQNTKDATVPVEAQISLNPPGILVSWANPTPANLLVLRRTKGQAGNQWVQVLSQTNSSFTGVIDNSVELGQTYEYVVQRVGTVTAFGYAHVSLLGPLVDQRGKVLILVDSTTADALGVELKQLKDDMRGDGWTTVPIKVSPTASVQSVKDRIIAEYNADPENVKSVLLFGRVPIPYSGNTAWDAHSDHVGAWPADNFYADMNGVWTDNTVNNVTASRTANHNIPGDGKFDQSVMPTAAELEIGRVDFRRLSAATFGLSEIELLRRYLNKNHRFRSGQYVPAQRAIIDDNFGYFSGEAFAANGFRNGYPLVGDSNIVQGDFFNDTDNQSFIMGYACGGGSYTSASGVGNSNNFATDSVNIVFSNIFGSYHGDWDFETNPFMPAALAGRGSILTCSWAGRPHWFTQAFASGETMGYCTKETQNAQFNNGFFGSFGESGAHVALLGDPTLRAHIIPPPSNLSVASNCTTVELNWTESPDTNIIGYLVYRSESIDGPYERITNDLIVDASYSDAGAPSDTLFYQVRAIAFSGAPGGGIYVNNSIGPIANIVHTAGTPPVINFPNAPTITCAAPNALITPNINGTPTAYAWSGPGGFSANTAAINVSEGGQYSLTVTDGQACSAEASINVLVNTAAPVITTSASGTITCNNPQATLTVSSDVPILTPVWATPLGGSLNGFTVNVSIAGAYTVTATATGNGCSTTNTILVDENTLVPFLTVSGGIINCSNPTITLSAATNTSGATWKWTGPGNFMSTQQFPSISDPGEYTVVVTAPNGCTNMVTVEVEADVVPPSVSATVSNALSCSMPTATLTGESTTNGVLYAWSGNGLALTQPIVQVNQSGIYTLTVTAQNGCTNTVAVTVVSDGSLPSLDISGGGTLTCSQTLITLTAMSDAPSAVFQWQTPDGPVSGASVNAGLPGPYTVVVTNTVNGCSNSTSTLVTQDVSVPNVTLNVTEQLDCNTPCLTLPPTPGVDWSQSIFCEEGSYTLVATNQNNGCTATTTLVIQEAPALVVAIDDGTPMGCGPWTSTLTALVNGGTPPYQYLWMNGATSPSIDIPLPSTTSLTVSDAGGCVFQSFQFVVDAPPGIIGAFIKSDESAAGANDGMIQLSYSGGSGSFTYLWSNGATTPGLSGLAGGDYTCTITDTGTGCTSTITITINTLVATDEAAVFAEISLSPNPTEARSVLSLRLQQAEPVQIRVFDARGVLVWETNREQVQELRMPIDLGDFPQGLYRVQIKAGEAMAHRNLLIQK